jgi:6-phosphogluconolactonase
MIRAIVLLSLTLAGSSTRLFGQVVYVANTLSNDVSAYSVDPGSGALTAVPGSPFPAWPLPVAASNGDGPSGAAVDPGGKFLYVANPYSRSDTKYISAYTIGTTSGALTAVTGSPFAVAGLGTALDGVALDPAGKFLYVGLPTGAPDASGVLALTINASSGVLTGFARPTNVNYAGPFALVVSPTGKFVYGAGGDSGVFAYTANASSGALTAAPGSPSRAGIQSAGVAVAMDPAGKFVYVLNGSPCNPSQCAYSYVSGDSVSAYSVNASSGALTPIPGSPFPDAGLGPSGAAVDPTGKFLYVSNASSGSVSAYTINASSGALTAVPGSPFFSGNQPAAVAVDPSGKFLYVANNFSNTISAYTINASSGALTPVPGSPFATGKAPVAIAIRSQPLPPSLAISAIAPSSATAGGPAFTLTVSGTGFVSSATVQWNGSPLATTFISAKQLSAAVPASLIAASGSAGVTVAAGATVSKAISFTINPVGISISSNDVINGASHVGGAVSPGEIVIITGIGFDSGAQALFDGVAAPILSAQAGQMTAVVPYAVNGNPSTQLQVSYQGQRSSAVAVPVAVAAPGIFTADGSGSGQGIISNDDGTLNSPDNPAAVGSTVLVSATGEGQTIPSGVDGKPGDSPAPVPIKPVTATVGGLVAQIVSAGGVSGMVAGFLQVAVQIPDGVTPGDSVPIVLTIRGITSQPNVTLAIQ